jgi:hypothetical protein
MANSIPLRIRGCVQYLQTGYRFGLGLVPGSDLLGEVATEILMAIARSDAAYHNLEHTIQVALVGQEILQGKHRCEGNVTPDDWLHFLLALLCHDIGYIKGICQGDRPDENRFVTGQGSAEQSPPNPAYNLPDENRFVTGQGSDCITLAPKATGASLTPFHVDRGKQFIAERFANHPKIDVTRLQGYIELTRFPVPNDEAHRCTLDYPGLTRAADLIGQLSDPNYLVKIPALFEEFAEIGSNQALGYRKPSDLRAGYPKFYWNVVSQYVHHGIRYLEITLEGKPVLENLYTNLKVVEHELTLAAA